MANNSEVPLEQRQLSDLSDYEIASLTQEVKAEQASSRPFVGEVEPLSRLADEYQSETYLAKIGQLEKDGWTGLRRLRGDGNCFYRGEFFRRARRACSTQAGETESHAVEQPSPSPTWNDSCPCLRPLLNSPLPR